MPRNTHLLRIPSQEILHYSDRPQSSRVAGVPKGKQCSFDSLEFSDPAIYLICAILGWNSNANTLIRIRRREVCEGLYTDRDCRTFTIGG